MTKTPILVVEDDPFLRVVGILLDPATAAERHAAYADFFAHDEPDFDGYCARVRERIGALFPSQVRLVETIEDMRASLPGARGLIVESLPVGPAELAAGSDLVVVQKYGAMPRNIDTAACAAISASRAARTAANPRGVPGSIMMMARRASAHACCTTVFASGGGSSPRT